MWSGGAAGGPGNGGQWTQWSFNPNAYAHLPHDQVDWAALAQQWIQMKDSQQIIPAQHQARFPDPTQVFLAPSQFPGLGPGPGFGIDATAVVPQPGEMLIPNILPQMGLAVRNNGFSLTKDPWTAAIQEQKPSVVPELAIKEDWSNSSDSLPANEFSYQQGSFSGHHSQPPPHQHHQRHQQQHHSEEWSSPAAPAVKKFSSHSKHEHHHHHHQQQPQPQQQQQDVSRTTQELDAIRRKSLPAWIREGLEKVEREKRKKQEREEQEAMKAKLDAEKAKLKDSEPVPSKWTNALQADDGNDYDHAEADREVTPVPLETLKDRIKSFLIDLNKEENFDQLMLCVRRQLTAILLDGTNQMMGNIVHEMLAKYKRKASQVKKTKAVASLKSELGGFGLTSYGGSDSEEDEDSDADAASSGGGNRSDTEEELMMEIENRKRDFQHVQTLRSLGHDMNDTPSEDQSKKSEVTTGDNSKVQSKESTSSSSPEKETNGNCSVDLSNERGHQTDSRRDQKTHKSSPASSSSTSESNNGGGRSRSRSLSRERSSKRKKGVRSSRKSRSTSRDRGGRSKKSHSRSRSREKKSSKRSRSHERAKKSRRSRSASSSSRSASVERTKKSSRRSKSRERRKRSVSVETKKSRRHRSGSRSRNKKSKKSRSRSKSRERKKSSKRSRSDSRSRSRKNRSKSKSRSTSRERRRSKRSRSRDRKKSSKRSTSRSKSRERKHSSKSSKSHDGKKSKKRSRSRSRSEESRRK